MSSKDNSEHLIDNYWVQHGMPAWQNVDEALWSWDDVDLGDEEEVEVPTSSKFVIPHPKWAVQAACYGMGDTPFFGGDGTAESPAMTVKQRKATQKICLSCPVRIECLNASLTNREEYGIWAGVTPKDREKLFEMIDNGIVDIAKVLEDFTHRKWRKYGVRCE